MRKRAARTFVAVILATAMTGITVFADDVSSLTKQKNQAQSDLDSLQNELSYILVEMDTLESNMVDVSVAMDQANVELQQAENTQKQQYQDMKLRIKYMYEDQDTSIMETLLTSDSMGEVLNKAEYMQKVYDYDREKLEEMAVTSKTISDKKTLLADKQSNLESLQSNLTSKQELLYTTITEKQKTVDNFGSLLTAATDAAAKKRQQEQAAAAKAVIASVKPAGNANIGQAVASLAYNYIGTPYVSAGSAPGGFDCSGFTSYLYRQFGITLSRSSSDQRYGGTIVSGGLSNALPGDIICYPGHVAMYVGNGEIIHATVPRSTVKLTSATGINLPITAVVRYW